MLLNLTDILTSEGKTEEYRLLPETTSFSCGGTEYKVQSMEPVVLTVSGNGKGRARLTGTCRVVLVLACDRCLKDVPYTFELSFDNQVYVPEVEELSEEEREEGIPAEGGQLDIESLISHEILLNWPMKILCRQDCRGICKVCGKDLNNGECGCDTFVPDPRMAKIKEIFNRDKEV